MKLTVLSDINISGYSICRCIVPLQSSELGKLTFSVTNKTKPMHAQSKDVPAELPTLSYLVSLGLILIDELSFSEE